MSAYNGDKARFHRLRKAKLSRRNKLRLFRSHAASLQAAQPELTRSKKTQPKAA